MSLDLRVAWPESGLAGAYARGDESVLPFFAGGWRDGEAVRARAEAVRATFERPARERAAAALRPSGEAARRTLQRVVEEGGFFVTTGQQPGLFTGPLYTIYKALTAAALAGILEERLGAPVLPVFWIASEDHDWAEVDHAHLVGVDNELHEVRLPPQEGSESLPLHRLPLGDGVVGAVEEALALLPDTDFSPAFAELLRRAWRPGETLPGGMRTTLETLLEPFGVAFVDAADPALKAASLPVLRREIEGAEAHEAALAAGAEALESAGWPVQVPILQGGVNLFVEGPAGRERLYRQDGAFRLRHSGQALDTAALLARLEDAPDTVSPNVLLRPVVEAAALPTVAYVAGPGETAYWAQLAPLFEAHGVSMPAVVPRLSVTVVEGKVAKVLEKFSLSIEALSRPFHELAGDLAREEVPEDVQRALGELRGAIGQGTAALEKEARSLDPTLKGPIQHVRSVAFDALGEAEKKIVAAVKRESEVALQQIEKARLHLHPAGKPQERVTNVFYYLARYGDAFLEDVARVVRANLAEAFDVQRAGKV
ncbi:MAG: bacillithiol biosynthesis cysteine-adding enzyme BshC [Gemmatimonadetes bacterium]|nr:bacillithiol biosynthesis cysteine-adding enzyme BshC [Gemmatimonadota bacterium]